MIKAIIVALNALSALLNEIEDLIEQLESVPAPANIMELDHERILEEVFYADDTFDSPRNMSVISMLPIRPELTDSFTTANCVSFHISNNQLKTTIWY